MWLSFFCHPVLDDRYTKEAWACMSHIVLEGRRITCMTNVNNSPRLTREAIIPPLSYFRICDVLKYKEA